uniref:Uncharacterized protein n=1 Tax=Fibrocapsa japonica TaxID=94617 RepID=A0A7S2XVX6_9STRA
MDNATQPKSTAGTCAALENILNCGRKTQKEKKRKEKENFLLFRFCCPTKEFSVWISNHRRVPGHCAEAHQLSPFWRHSTEILPPPSMAPCISLTARLAPAWCLKSTNA